MNIITLDFSGVDSLWNLHEYLKEAFRLPDYYGHNMDALWDCLHCAFDEPTAVILKNISAVPEELKRAVGIMLKVFDELENEDPEVTVRIEAADGTYLNVSDFMAGG